jgi:hypothetical protein
MIYMNVPLFPVGVYVYSTYPLGFIHDIFAFMHKSDENLKLIMGELLRSRGLRAQDNFFTVLSCSSRAPFDPSHLCARLSSENHSV